MTSFFEQAQMFTRDLTPEEEVKVLNKKIPPIRRCVDATPPIPQQEYENLKARVLAARQVVEDYRQKHQKAHRDGSWNDKLSEQLIDSLHRGYTDNGFKDEDDFHLWNRRLCKEEMQRCFQLLGNCDGCPDRTPSCIFPCANMSGPRRWEPYILSACHYKYFPEKGAPNCNMSRKQIFEPSFDIYWEMPEPFDLRQYGVWMKKAHPENYKKLKTQFKDDTEYGDMFSE